MAKEYKAAMVVIGNEILSGRTQDKNINYVANALNPQGISLVEVRVVPDIEETIIKTIHDLNDQVDYIFTSGGIGPTHDDITSECIAKACSAPLEQNDEAYDLLLEYYGEEGFTDARKKMAQIPVGASLIPNPVSVAPGFIIDKVYVMAGVPSIFQAMVDFVIPTLTGGAVLQTRSIICNVPESVLSKGLGEINDKYGSVDIGSYPRFVSGGIEVNVILRSTDQEELDSAYRDAQKLVDSFSKHM